MRRKVNIALLLLIVLIGAPFYWLLLDNRPGDAAAKPITVEQLRNLAASLPGPAPSGVEVEQVAYRVLPRNLFAAGSGMKPESISVLAWRLTVPGGDAIMIDGGIAETDARAIGMDQFFAERQAKVEKALRGASLIIATHEHPDHQGAIVRLGEEVVTGRARFNAGQLPPARFATDLAWGSQPIPPALIAAGPPQAVAPGVVVIPAPSHTPGSQMIFVRLQDGRELLFAGDIATMASSWQETRARSRLVGDFLAPEDRSEVFAWLRTIQKLKQAAPALMIVPGHDWHRIHTDPALAETVRIGFSQQPTG
jgi:glyoxylase-like metal-dependent hydrolase (beta-lactamase superfamily II)